MVSQISRPVYEEDTQAIARELLAQQQSQGSWLKQLRDQARLEDKLLAWAMGNPGLRVQLFQLIDTLSTLEDKAEIARHLQEYLAVPSVELPQALKQLINFATPDAIPGQIAASTFAAAVTALAHKYIAGDSIPQILKTIVKLRQQQMAFTIDRLGEAVITEAEAEKYWQGYLQLITELGTAAQSWPLVPQIDQADGAALPRAQVSVKLTAFYSQFDPLDATGSEQGVGDRLRQLLRHAQTHGVAIHFDMEQYRYKDLTLRILKGLLMEPEFRQNDQVGLTLQAYLQESYADLQSLIEWAKQRGTPVTLRLVKGAYWDQETIQARQKHWPAPVFAQKAETDVNFERMTQLLLENHAYLYAAIGSHNVRSQAKAIAIAKALQVPRRRVELQVLYGMADKLAQALVQQGFRVRVYCPYGQLLPGMAYLIRRLLENTANSSFLRQSQETESIESLLTPPGDRMESAQIDSRPEKTDPPAFTPAADTDYSETNNRDQGLEALVRVRQRLGQTYGPLVNGEWLTGVADQQDSVNPSRPSEVIGRVGQVTVDQAEAAVQAAQQAFKSWKKQPVSQRAAILRRAADLMAQRRADLAAWMVLEVGKVLREADVEISEAIDFCRYYAAEMERLDQGFDRDVAGETNHYLYQPRGLALVISPWNFPLAIPVGMTVAALVAGNCVLLKPAEPATVIAARFAEILVEAGIPPGVFQYLPGPGSQVGAYLVQHPAVHLIAFTGSQAVGCQIYAEAAKLQPGQQHLKRVIAEMGGKNAIIVDHSADLDQAVQGVVQSAFGYSGQKCSACSRVIVLESVYEVFVERLVAAIESLNVGAADEPGTMVGPVINAQARDRMFQVIQQAQTEAKLTYQGAVPEQGYFVGPTLFTEVAPNSTLAQTEIFGPVLAVLRAKGFEEALAIANGTRYALTGGLYSRTPSHIAWAKADFEVGNLYINRTTTGAIVDRQPFGGFKLSGVGSKAGGPDYLIQFLEPRVITENMQRQGFAPIAGVDD